MKIKRVIELSLVLLFVILAATAVSATVYVNEFLANGPTPEPQSEWIELYNSGSTQVYLTGWNITDGEGAFTLPASVIPANGFVVLAYNRTLFNSLYSTSATVIEYGPGSTGNFNLANTNDNIDLYDSIGTLSDQFVYATSQVENVSYGRNYDGGNVAHAFTTPTPGTYNNRKPVIGTIPNQTFAEDNNLTINFANYITDPDNNAMNLTISAIANVATSVNNMFVTFTPNPDFYGIRTFTVTASDGLSSTTSNTIRLNITAVNDAPRVNIPTVSIPEDSWNNINLNTYATDPDSSVNNLIWSRIGGDSNIQTSISTNNIVTFTPVQDFCGLTSVILRANDTINYTDATVNVNVVCVQDSPVISLISPTNGASLNANSAALQWTGSDVDNDALTYEVFTGNLATNLSSYLNTTANSTTLTGLTNGQTVYWQVIVKDNHSTPIFSPVRSFSILLNTAPQITSYTPSSPVIVVKNNSQAFNVTVTDVDNNIQTHQWSLNGTAVSNTTSFLLDSTNYAPGQYQLLYNVTDSYPASTTQTWVVNIRYRNPPTFSGPIPYLPIDEGSYGTINLKNYFNDSDGDILTYTATSANDLSVTISNGIATITPSNGFFGSRGIKFTASDGLNSTSSNIVNIFVKKSNTNPQIDASYTPSTTSVKTANGKTLSFHVAAYDYETDPMSFKWYVDSELKQETKNSNYNLMEYPNYFISYGYFNGQVVVGGLSTPQETSAANKIVESLKEIGLNINNIYTPDQIRNNNLILVGTPTSNSKIAELLNSQTINLNDNEGLIKTFNYNGYVALVVTGKTGNDVYAAAQALADFDQKHLSAEAVSVATGSTFNPLIVIPLSDTSDFDFTPTAGGTFTVKVEVIDSSGAKDTQQWTVEISDKPVADTFDGATTNFDTMSEENLVGVNLVLERTAFGKIVFDNPIDMRDVVDLDAYVNIGQGLVAIDTVHLPELNQPATVTLYNININNPVIYYSGIFTNNYDDAQKLCNFCTSVSYQNNQLTFHVAHFSTLVVKEATSGGILLPDAVQLGSDNEGRDQNITTQFTITNPGTNESVNDITLTSSTPLQYHIEFSTGTTYSSSLTLDLAPGESKTINLRGYIPKKADGGLYSIGQIRASNGDYSDSAPLYIYPKNNLEILSVKVDGDSVSDDDVAEIKPDTTLDIEVEVKNIGTVDFDEVTITATIYDLDDDDVEEEVEFSLQDGRRAEKTLTFNIPEDLDEDEYDLKIEIEAEDDDGITYTENYQITLETTKEKHKLSLDATLSTETYECIGQPNIYTQIKNLGANDEDDVKIEITNSQLGINIVEDEIDIDEDDDFKRTFTLNNLEQAQAGTYSLAVTVYLGSSQETQELLNLEVKDCQKSTELTQQQKSSIQQKHQQLITQALAQHAQPVVVEAEEKTPLGKELAWLFLVLTSLLTLGVLIFAVGAVIIKAQRK